MDVPLAQQDVGLAAKLDLRPLLGLERDTPEAMGQALSLIGGWERMRGLPASNPQFFVGARARGWLTSLEARTPVTTTPKVGRPAIEEK